jgi:hypothetical protein
VKKSLLCWLVFLPLVLSAAEVFQGDGLCRFILENYSLPKANEDKINFIVANLLQRHEAVFNFTPVEDFHIRIRIFGRFEDFKNFASTNQNIFETSSISNLAGYYSSRDQEVVTWRQHDPTYLANNILHECSHAIMHAEFRALPIWLDEGCAVYFSFPVFMRSESATRRLEGQWLQLKLWLDQGSLQELKKFVNISPSEFRAMDPARAYLTGWSLFQLLMSTPENRKVMNDLIRDYQPQLDMATWPPDCAKLLDKSYPGGVAKLERDWHAWIERGAANVIAQHQESEK